MDPTDDFNTDAFFNDGTLQQIEQGAALDANLQHLGNVTLPANPAVVQRILNLHSCGSLQDVAWSRQGLLAHISEDGADVHLQSLIFNKSKSIWELSKKHSMRTTLESITLLVWSPTGGDLAVADSKGRVSILQAHATAMNRFTEVRHGMLDEPDEFGQVVGMTWLSQDRIEKPRNVVLHATKTDDRWSTIHGRSVPFGPLWQRAVVTVDRKANFSIYFQKADTRYGKASIPLGPASATYFTHAAFAPTTEGKLLVALHSYNSNISLYHVSMDFSQVRASVDATVALSVETVATRLATSASGMMMTGDVYDPDSWSLTHLGIVPPSEIENAMQSQPTVFAIYSNSTRNITPTDPGFLVSSVIRRWTIVTVEQKLHPRFEDLPTKSDDTNSSITYAAHRLPDKHESVITSAIQVENGQNLVIGTIDGRTDFLSTMDLSSLMYAASTTEVTSLASSGFAFPISVAPLCMTPSPNACMQANRGLQDKVELAIMEFQHNQDGQNLDLTNPTIDAAIAAVLTVFSRACWTNSNIDDLLTCIKHTFPASMSVPILVSLYRTLFRDVEFIHEKAPGSELEKVIQKPVLTKVLSFHWGTSLMNSPTSMQFKASLSGKWAWLSNNFRFVATLLYLCYREYSDRDSVAPQDLIEITCGNIRWCLDVFRFITTTILEVGDRQTNPEFFDDPPEGESADGSQGLVALLLNCHWSRSFMIAVVRAFRMFAKLPEPRSRQQAQVIRTIHKYSTAKGMNLVTLEGALLDYRWYSAGDTETDIGVIASRQIEMMATGIVAEPYVGSIKRILTRLFNAPGGMREKNQIDRLKLFTDRVTVDQVLLTSEWEHTHKGEKIVYDVHKKRLITRGLQESKGSGELFVKRCVRCGCYNEDVAGSAREWPRHINALIARCVCDGSWMVEPWNKSDND